MRLYEGEVGTVYGEEGGRRKIGVGEIGRGGMEGEVRSIGGRDS